MEAGAGSASGEDERFIDGTKLMKTLHSEMYKLIRSYIGKFKLTQTYDIASKICKIYNIGEKSLETFIENKIISLFYTCHSADTAYSTNTDVEFDIKIEFSKNKYSIVSSNSVIVKNDKILLPRHISDSFMNYSIEIVDKLKYGKCNNTDFKRALLHISIIKNTCSCYTTYSKRCYCAFISIKNHHISPRHELFSTALWSSVIGSSFDIDSLFYQAIVQLKDYQRAQFCNFFEKLISDETLERNAYSIVKALNNIDKTRHINPPLRILLIISLYSNGITKPINILKDTYELPNINESLIRVSPTKWIITLDDFIMKNSMTKEERVKLTAIRLEEVKEKERIEKEEYNKLSKILDDYTRNYDLNKIKVTAIDIYDGDAIAELKEEIVSENEEFTSLIMSCNGYSCFKKYQLKLNIIKTKYKSLIQNIQNIQNKYLKTYSVIELLCNSMNETVDSDENINKILRTAFLQAIIYCDKWTPGFQNRSLDHITSMTIKESKEFIKNKLINIFKKYNVDIRTSWIDAFMIDVLTESQYLFSNLDSESKSEPDSIKSLISYNYGIATQYYIKTSFCWHCGGRFCDVPTEIPETRGKRRYSEYKCRKQIRDHLKSINSICDEDTNRTILDIESKLKMLLF